MTGPARRVLITGADGQLGRALRETAPGWAELSTPGRDELDITAPESVRRAMDDVDPHWIVNAAGYTDVDGAEADPDRAAAVNADGPRNLALGARRADRRMLHVSTDFVFDGASGRPYPPDATPAPLSVYGRTKLDGERNVRQILGQDALLVRTAWLYSSRGRNFVHTLLRLLEQRDEIRVVADQVGTPTWARALADALWAMVERGLAGIHHWTDAGVASWYDFAVAIQEEASARGLVDDRTHIAPIPSEEYPTAARRPGYGVLDKSGTWRALGRASSHWRVSLRRMLDELEARRSP